MRALFFVLALVGVLLGVVYPAAIDYFSGEQIASLPVYDRGRGFSPVTVRLDAADAPVRVMLDATTFDTFSPPHASAHLTVTASTAARTVLAKPVLFVVQQQPNGNSNARKLGATAGLIDQVESGDYRFEVNFADAGPLPFRAVELVLRRNAAVADERAQPIGYVLIAIGVIGFVLALTRGGGNRGGGGNDAPQPRPPQWGRDAAPPG